MTKLAILLLLSGCSIVFDPAEPATASLDREDGNADGSITDGDGGVDNDDSGIGPGVYDASVVSADATPLDCDPFNGSCGCYVDNSPTAEPACGATGDNLYCTPCNFSRDCVPGMFCTGDVFTPGVCKYLCGGPAGTTCAEGACLNVFSNWGYCGEACP